MTDRLGTSAMDLRDRTGARWHLRLSWSQINGRAEVVEATIASAEDPPRPITSTVIRTLNVGSAIDESRSSWAEQLLHLEDERWAPHAAAMAGAGSGRRPGGRSPLSADQLADVALVYRAALAEGAPTGRAVADQLHLSLSGAAKRIRKARDAGLIPPAIGGRS